MTSENAPWAHHHRFQTGAEAGAERRASLVVIITLVTMVVEIAAGWWTGSMALLADGIHMSTHALALGIAAYAYRYARRHADDPRYSFGTGKVGALAGFTSALGLAAVAVAMIVESATRLLTPQTIDYDDALVVAVVGLVVNIACAVVLAGGGDADTHSHAHAHHHGGHHHGGHHHGGNHHGGNHQSGVTDHNLKSAHAHVVTDALTSVLAIMALGLGKWVGAAWLDPLMGVVGGVVVGWWAIGLTRETAGVLLDRDDDGTLSAKVRAALEGDGDDRVGDLHIWRVGPAHHAAIIALATDSPCPPTHYKARLSHLTQLAHVTVEVHQRDR